MRWVVHLWPQGDLDRIILGKDPFVVYEAPKGPGQEVRLATEAETGLFTLKALPPPRAHRA